MEVVSDFYNQYRLDPGETITITLPPPLETLENMRFVFRESEMLTFGGGNFGFDDAEIEPYDPAKEQMKFAPGYGGRIGMGPNCPHCGECIEWTVGEIYEDVYADKIGICSHCFQMYTLDMDEVKAEQARCREALEGPE